MRETQLAGVMIDEELNFRFEVWAYRPVTEAELQTLYNLWLRESKKNRPRRNETIKLVSVLGANE